MSKPNHEFVVGFSRDDLPAYVVREVGRIITKWARYEYLVQQMIGHCLDLNDVEARIAIRAPRVTDRLDMLIDLLSQREAMWNADQYKKIYELSKELATKRDILAHGIWGVHDNIWHVQRARGAYPKSVQLEVGKSRVIMPEMIPMSQPELVRTRKYIEDLIILFDEWRKSIQGSQRKPPKR